MKSEFGQALIEVTVASGLALIVISAIAITTIIGLRNSQFAQNQIVATKYAQEGLEQIRSIQSRDCPVNSSMGTFYWYDNPSDRYVWDFTDFPPGSSYTITLDSTNCKMDVTTNGQALSNNRFFRKITIDETNDSDVDKIKVSSVVTWTDFAGAHQSQLVTILSKY